ncbi:OmpA family protein [Spongiibacter sp. KMU-158]|uniref:OmpA family protein n=1 Tax=Spongiibacter pelagi TaxID=2760804 RepID=A0A927C102_9GAMM|nr:OmpA family protein [Spongiibacter pelagi]MBD2858203.1 OmpA family protein [Spongiibacter pelagi]
MRNWQTCLLAASLTSVSLNGLAQVEEKHFDDRWRIHGMAGVNFADKDDFDTGTEFKIGLGKPLSRYIMLDGQLSLSTLTTDKDDDYERMAMGLDFLFFPGGAFDLEANKLQPYIGVGLTYHEVDFLNVTENNYGGDLLGGLQYEMDKVTLRAEVRYQVDKIGETENSSGVTVLQDDDFYTWGAMLGISVPFGDKPKPYNWDDDGDGVPDRLDRCPNTPRGTPVDSHGCPLDKDADGVPDFRDQCPDTPAGAKVNADGCSLDHDGDGVPNDIDQCLNTPRGEPVDSRGCALDSDKDGVPNKIDICPNTLPGAKVNSQGCVISQTVELKGIHFDFNSKRLQLDSKSILRQVAESLKQEPSVNIVVAGHTDSVGSDEYNYNLSKNRAESVVAYLVEQGVAPSRLRAVGYGETRPIDDNNTEEGRERNRRVELQLTSQNR